MPAQRETSQEVRILTATSPSSLRLKSGRRRAPSLMIPSRSWYPRGWLIYDHRPPLSPGKGDHAKLLCGTVPAYAYVTSGFSESLQYSENTPS